MTTFTPADSAHMARALQRAARGLYSAHPNPMVGCVVVAGDEVVGEGWHVRAGDEHAEINALREAGGRAAGATVYVSLEPCAHHGKTPPCAEALVEAGVARVVAAMEDPYSEVAGRGLERLRDAGIETAVGLMESGATALNEGFVNRVKHGRPLVRMKVATSIDGATAMESGESQWITGPAARHDVQKLRARSGAVMTGIGTVLADDPSLNVRDASIDTHGVQPLRVVLDTRLRMPLAATMLTLPGETLVCCVEGNESRELEAAGAEVIEIGTYMGDSSADDAVEAVNAFEVLAMLAERGVNDVLVEAGPRLAGHLVEKDLVDELVIYQAPHIMGSNTRGMFATPAWQMLGDRRSLDIIDVRSVGSDMRITARPAN